MEDNLIIGFDKDEKTGEIGICVSRNKDGEFTVLKNEIGEQANILYKVLTNQKCKIVEITERRSDV